MGYWSTDPDGNSGVFEPVEGEVGVWGDQPADVIDDALDKVMATFVHDMGRLPTQAEVVAGLKFSLPTFLDRLPKSVEEAEAKADEVLAGWWADPANGYYRDPVSESAKAFDKAFYAATDLNTVSQVLEPKDRTRLLDARREAWKTVSQAISLLQSPEREAGVANQEMRPALRLVEDEDA